MKLPLKGGKLRSKRNPVRFYTVHKVEKEKVTVISHENGRHYNVDTPSFNELFEIEEIEEISIDQ